MAVLKKAPEGLMTVEQVAAYLQLNKLTIYKFIRSGNLPAVRLGRSFRVRPSDVDEFLEAHKVGRMRAGRPQPVDRPLARGDAMPRTEKRRWEREPTLAHETGGATEEERRRSREAMISSNPLEWVIRGLH